MQATEATEAIETTNEALGAAREASFLREVRETLRSGDALLLGTDLEKDIALQLLAYDDPAGVTAALGCAPPWRRRICATATARGS